MLTQAQESYTVYGELLGIAGEGQNPFYQQNITQGRISANTDFLAVVGGNYQKQYTEKNSYSFGLETFLDYSPLLSTQPRLNTAYAALQLNRVAFVAGAKPDEERLLGLSSTNGDILRSNNARALPGVSVQMTSFGKIWDWLGIQAGIANYWLTDDRVVENTMVHHKNLSFKWTFTPKASLTAGVYHYAQWGGTSPDGKEPAALVDYWRVFVGKQGGETARVADQANAVGNHIGSYHLHYKKQFEHLNLELYHQNLFEDSSGREFAAFPDGVWGVFLGLPNNNFVKGLLYEYVQTNNQSGFAENRGGDNYFNNGKYVSGWTYHGKTIGLPFMLPRPDGRGIVNNLVQAHHFGAYAATDKISFKGLFSYAENQGTRLNPYFPESPLTNLAAETVLHAYLESRYQLSTEISAGLSLAMDNSDTFEDVYAVLFSLKYRSSLQK
ncbi:hypothetical protein GCM10011414_25960 [Croceivirga lutea]|nr:hypothetical protein GCM10011414_25960 [Croceivirga lutea]